ncbi:MAG: transporter substrate-binding protein [Brevibacillus sp.]|nr:transporter substrate-binding protein [Brevibacillus sp.]
MKKGLLVFLTFLMLMVTGCSQETGSISQEKSTIEKIQEKKKLVVGFGSGDIPFHVKDKKGNWVGYEVDLAKAMAEVLKVEVEFKQFEFSALIPALQNGDIDIILSAMTIRGDRALAVTFSEPYYSTGAILMVPKTDSSTKSWEDLDKTGKKIAVSQGTTGALLAKNIIKQANILDYDSLTNAAMAVSQGQADGLIYDETAVRVYEMMYPDTVRGIYNLISTENLGIAMKLNDVRTQIWINSFLDSYKNSPADLASHKKWFETNDWLSEVEQKK